MMQPFGACNRGFVLGPELLGLVAGRGITLGFDIFCSVDTARG